MNKINKIFHLPKEENKFKEATRSIEECDIINSIMFEDKEGPKIEEIYTCSCGDIILRQKSIIADVDNPENGSIEIVQLESDGCVL
jgi:hypothetical protein